MWTIENPEFSIVVPTIGRAHLLQQGLRSILRQTVNSFEVLVVRDGGDGSELRMPDDPRFKVISRASQGGAAAARNTGIAAAKGRYLTFLDDDDEFTPDRLAIAKAGLVSAPIALCWKAGLEHRDLRWARRLDGYVEGTLLESEVPQLGSGAFLRTLVKPLDASLPVSEDVEWWLRMSSAGEMRTIPRVGYLIRDHDGPRLRDRTAERLEARLRLLEAHHDYFTRHRRAASYQWLRVGGLAESVGDTALAVRAYSRSLGRGPSIKTLAHLGHAAASSLLRRIA